LHECALKAAQRAYRPGRKRFLLSMEKRWRRWEEAYSWTAICTSGSKQVSPYKTRPDLGDTRKLASSCNQGETLGPEISPGSIDQYQD